MITPFLQGERRHITRLLLGAHQRSLMKIRGDPILLPVEMMLIMVMRSKFFIATALICHHLCIETDSIPLPTTVLSVASQALLVY